MVTADDFDPEMLEPVEKIRYAEQLMRSEHRVLGDDYLFWGNLADYLNMVAHTPEKTGNTQHDWREFNRAQDMATGYIRMSARKKDAATAALQETAPGGAGLDRGASMNAGGPDWPPLLRHLPRMGVTRFEMMEGDRVQ